MKKTLILLSVLLFTKNALATNLISAMPIADKVVELVFVDGKINHHNLGMSRTMDSVSLFPGGRLSTTIAQVLSNYNITSSNDANYTVAKNPIRIGINKRIEQTWTGDWEGRPTHVEEIHVYLFLQHAMQNNKQYTFTANASTVNAAAKTQQFILILKHCTLMPCM